MRMLSEVIGNAHAGTVTVAANRLSRPILAHLNVIAESDIQSVALAPDSPILTRDDDERVSKPAPEMARLSDPLFGTKVSS